MKVDSAWKKLGRHHREISVTGAEAELRDLKVNHPSKRQRMETKRLSKAKYLHCELFGNQLDFAATYCLETGILEFIDGYTRVEALIRKLASLPATGSVGLTIHTVATDAEVQLIYDQYNSLDSAKNSGDYFDSGLNQVGLRNGITSHLIAKGPRAMAVQHAYGKKGSKQTRAATVAMIVGLKLVDSWQLHRRSGEIGGLIGAYLAIAQYSPDAEIAETFVRSVNQAVYTANRSKESSILAQFRGYLAACVTRTGGAINQMVFDEALDAFYRYYCAAKKRTVKATVVSLADFQIRMSQM